MLERRVGLAAVLAAVLAGSCKVVASSRKELFLSSWLRAVKEEGETGKDEMAEGRN